MGRVKQASLGLLLVGWIATIGVATRADGGTQAGRGTQADAAWGKVVAVSRRMQSNDSGVAYAERDRRAYREAGLRFWREFPDDLRRYEWLLQTNRFTPRYTWDLDLGGAALRFARQDDLAAQVRWEKLYSGIEREVQLEPLLDENRKFEIASARLYQLLLGVTSNGDDPVRLESLQGAIMSVANRFPLHDVESTLRLNFMYSPYRFGLDRPARLGEFIRPWMQSRNAGVRELSRNLNNLAQLSVDPLELTLPALDGSSFNIAELRGKVVLIEFWDNYCNDCFDFLTRAKGIYAQYHDRGFEIVSVHVIGQREGQDSKTERAVGERIIRKNGWPWSTIRIDLRSDVGKEFYQTRFGLRASGTKFLLNGQGRLEKLNFDPNGLETEVRRLVNPDKPSHSY